MRFLGKYAVAGAIFLMIGIAFHSLFSSSGSGVAAWGKDGRLIYDWSGRQITVSGGTNRSVGETADAVHIYADGFEFVASDGKFSLNGEETPLGAFSSLDIAFSDTGIAVSADGRQVIDPDPALLRTMLEDRATKGDPSAQASLGLAMLEEGAPAPEAIALLEQAAKARNAEAALMLGSFYSRGRHVAKDRAKAQEFYRAAHEAGDALGTARLGQMLVTSGSAYEGEKLLEEAVKRREPEAKYYLAKLLEPRSKNNIVISGRMHRMLREAAKQGVAEAQYERALLYEEGVAQMLEALRSRSQRERASAVSWHKRAAEQGHVRAQFRLGEIYAEGLFEEPKDPQMACHWLGRAAKQGFKDAQDRLATMSQDNTCPGT